MTDVKLQISPQKPENYNLEVSGLLAAVLSLPQNLPNSFVLS